MLHGFFFEYLALLNELRGRVTTLDTLILSKIWYCLRLCSPTQKFFSTLQSLGYNFIWKKKCPLAAYDQLCLPQVHGGVSLSIRNNSIKFFNSNGFFCSFNSLIIQPVVVC
jgi:hypothetical protein